MLQRKNITTNQPESSKARDLSLVNKSKGCSRVSNGSALFVEKIDGRTPWARRFRDLIELHLADLGGPDNVNEAQCALIRRIATLECECERLEGEFAKPDRIAGAKALDLYSRLSNTLRRLLDALHLDRRP